MPVRLLALDIDGTLLNSRGEMTPRVRASLEAARERGVRIALVTGRRFRSARPIAQELNCAVPLISHNGALTKNVTTLETIGYHPLDADMTREIIRIGRACGVDMICCDDPDDLGVMVLEGVSPDNRALHHYLDKYRDSVVEVADLLEYVDHDPIQIMFSGCCDPMDEFAAHLQAAMDGGIQLFKTRYRRADLTILDALSTAASKGAGVEAIARAHGIAREEVMAVGDNHNDLTMLSFAGIGVVMGNAEEELKQAGFALTASNEEDGVAEAIERFILQAQ
ncbi:MAG TPA: Cof-type HAD-IIB family hydrolase [Blastocatellia bacterium]|nr:Cof-type HAD-IIB family hydrolase [Blastocatellia bacterium]